MSGAAHRIQPQGVEVHGNPSEVAKALDEKYTQAVAQHIHQQMGREGLDEFYTAMLVQLVRSIALVMGEPTAISMTVHAVQQLQHLPAIMAEARARQQAGTH